MDLRFYKLILIFWLISGLAVSYFLFLLMPAKAISQYKFFEIKSGEGFREISGSLKKEGLIRSKTVFLVYGAITGSAYKLKPGNYFLSVGSSTPEILEAVVRGPVIDREAIIPEGFTLKDIDAILAKENILPAGSVAKFLAREVAEEYDFLKNSESLEGFLFPDTYKFFLQGVKKDVVKKFLDNFQSKAWPFLKNQKDFRNTLIIASLLEKEVPNFNDRRIIAGILYKRLKINMPLQVDSTISYAKCKGAFATCDSPALTKQDLKYPSPYNTYLQVGLPPGPIGNPGVEAIRAAIRPILSDYLYYLSDPKTKKTIFSKTLEEQNENRAKYLKL